MRQFTVTEKMLATGLLIAGSYVGYANRENLYALVKGGNKATPEASPSPSPSPKTKVRPEGEAGGLYGDAPDSKPQSNVHGPVPDDRPDQQYGQNKNAKPVETRLKETTQDAQTDNPEALRLGPTRGAISPRGTQTENRYESIDEYMYATSPDGKQVSLRIHHYKEGNPVVVGNYQDYKLNDRVGIVERSAGGNVTTTVFRPQ